MKVASQPYLVLEIRREELLLDAFSQLWQREQRELHRPLRVRLGSDGGEIGHDLGGVQIEFFNLFCNEICDPQRGLFETDSNTHLSWFKAASLEPLHRYELLGLLFGIALFNGITLPISFPRVFYAKLMGWEVDWEDFLTDWPHLHSTFTQTAKYSGDIADLIQHEDQVNVEALKWPGWSIRSTTQASSPVTNENRTEYLKLYSKWVFDYSIRPQFYAFAAGFYRVVDVRAIRLLTPLSFQRLVEGSQDIDVEDLKHHTKYEACTSSTPTIKWFWSIVESYDQQKLRRLLEFVTASKRMPANGAAGLRFTIMAVEEQNGALPGSSTCFGILHLPKYETRDVMKQKLDIALEHSIGFGQA
ncbi:hypothetical protein K461DRAFT_227610 [Myriangium duriaei CBS 260.36]|uniref:HECT-type E3 ubiquitin transferase n=1 Tax=Myriangium duriaei CBS 260.36 TaxID=1168546 RepID=A0A9P4J0J9_9PEZI|nr:hypothetical protein K461DRAFT_227610 [Myriangium duriaei CBS 260.36]